MPDGASRDRLGLAIWITMRNNPLTARVAVNRFWKMLFGTGIVGTPADFGAQGETPPNHPLLEWLACEYRDSGWDMKHMVRLLVLSDTYRQTFSIAAISVTDTITPVPVNHRTGSTKLYELTPELSTASLPAGVAINATTGVISPTRVNSRRGTASYAGGPDGGTPVREKLLNLSTRSVTGSGNESLIAGFVVTGGSRKSMLIRAVGPTLARDFGVSSAVAGARLEVTRDGRSIGTSGAWATRPDASAIASAASRVGAFPLAPGSEDAALLLDLEPGAYTAVVSSSTNSSGVALIEVYDASGESAPRGDRTVNLSTRAGVGTGERVLIAGFFVGGDLPKRMLIRGIGPSLRAFGLTDALGRPTLTLFRGGSALARNSGWAGAADVAAASLQAGAFPLAGDAQDAALLLHLAPGAYTAQITGEGAASGVALVEVYEVD
jgi:hypothetical protein